MYSLTRKLYHQSKTELLGQWIYTLLFLRHLTILETLGFKLKNPRLGLDVSLFSSEPTLLESMGQEKLTKELMKNNQLYNSLWQ